MNGAPVSWKVKRQDCVTLSSAEVEYVAASMCGQEVVHLRAMLRGFGYEQRAPTVVWEDNAACIAIANNQVNRQFTRHIDVRLYFVRDLVRDAVLTLVKCAGTLNVADALTKSLPSPSFLLHRPFLQGTRQEYKAHYCSLGLQCPCDQAAQRQQPSQLTITLPCQGERRQPTLNQSRDAGSGHVAS
eukprot:2478218-Rhodomonas_salina.1